MLKKLRRITLPIKMTDLHAWLGRFIIWSAAAITGLVIVLFVRAPEQVTAWFYGSFIDCRCYLQNLQPPALLGTGWPVEPSSHTQKQ